MVTLLRSVPILFITTAASLATHSNETDGTSSQNAIPLPFLDGSESRLVQLLDRIDKELKVFTYPIPNGTKRCNLRYGGFTSINNPTEKLQFQMELTIPQFLKNHKTVATSKPEEADLFLIDHEWICILIGNIFTQRWPDKAEKYLIRQRSEREEDARRRIPFRFRRNLASQAEERQKADDIARYHMKGRGGRFISYPPLRLLLPCYAGAAATALLLLLILRPCYAAATITTTLCLLLLLLCCYISSTT
jgi:hypothetical protein